MTGTGESPDLGGTPPPPRVLIVMPEQWPRALLRAALREAGYDAYGAIDISEATRPRRMSPERGAPEAVVIDHDAVAMLQPDTVRKVVERLGVPVVFVAHATREVPEAPWRRVLRRPVSVEDIAHEVEVLLPLAREARKPVD